KAQFIQLTDHPARLLPPVLVSSTHDFSLSLTTVPGSNQQTTSTTEVRIQAVKMGKPIVLQLGDDIKWNHDLYKEFTSKFDIRRSYSMPRAEFIQALKDKKFGDFFAIYRPFWNTGGEMGNWDKELISLLPSSCKVYASAGAGFDWVDTETLASREFYCTGIIYCNAAAACTESVADGAIWLILSTFRLFSWSSAAARSGDPDQFVDANKNLGAVSRNPNGFSLGIIGFGKIGRRIAEKAHKSFDMKILYNDVVRMPADLEKSSNATYIKDMNELLATADCVLTATPFAGKTLLDAAAIAKMKKGAKLINIARGKLIEEEPLVAALKSGHLSAVGLDVHYNEPHVNKELIKMRNVEVLSHNAGASLDAHMGFERLGMENILSFASTGKAVTPVNAHLINKSRL
ncbi:D-isomer specific 2-hydroxyacid dehydrogenase, partial [Colletotrichum paranaense]